MDWERVFFCIFFGLTFFLFLCLVFYLIRSVFYMASEMLPFPLPLSMTFRLEFERELEMIRTRKKHVHRVTECQKLYLSFCSLSLCLHAKGHKILNLRQFSIVLFLLFWFVFSWFSLAIFEWQSGVKQWFVTFENVKQKSFTTKCSVPTIRLYFSSLHLVIQMKDTTYFHVR